MATIKEQLETRIQSIVDNKNTIRDTLASDYWDKRVTTEADLEEIAQAMLEIPTYGKELITLSRKNPSYDVPKGYHRGLTTVAWEDDDDQEAIDYKLYNQEDLTPTNVDRDIKIPDGHYGLTGFTLKKIPHPYHDVSSVNVPVNMVHPNYTFVDSQGNIKQGSMSVATPDSHTNIRLTPSTHYHSVPTGKYYEVGSTYDVGIPEDNFQVIQVTPEKNRIHHLASTNDKFISEVIVEPIPEAYVTGAYILSLLAEI